MSRGMKLVVAILIAAISGACTLLTDFSGLGGGQEDPTRLPDRSSSNDAAGGTDGSPIKDGGGIAPDAGPFHPKYERSATLTNLASAELAAGSTQCFMQVPTGAALASEVRPDLADVRVFGPTTERLRSIDVRAAGNVSLCFSLERAVAPGLAETYLIRYGDPSATPPPPAEPDLFPFWDGFDGTLSAQRWLVSGTVSVANGLLTLPKGQNAITTKAGQDEVPALASLEIRARIVDPTSKGSAETDGGTEFFWWLGFQRKGDFIAGDPWSIFIARSAGAVRAEHKTKTGSCVAGCSSLDKAQRADFRVYRIDRKTQQTVLIDDEGTVFTADGTNGDESVMIRNWLVSSDLVVDWARARPIVDPAPKFDLGPEELAP